MKKTIAYFIIISLLWGCASNGNVVSAKAKTVTVQDLSGVKRKLTIDHVKNLATELGEYYHAGMYAQEADGHYYYLRQTGKNNYYTLYRDKGKKVGSFKYSFKEVGYGYSWRSFGWHKGKLYVGFIEEDEREIKICVADFKKKSIKTICTLKFPASYKKSYMDALVVYLYQNKVYIASYNLKYDCKVREFDMSSGELLNTFSGPKLKKNESMEWITIADGKIYYDIEKKKGKKCTVTLRCIDTASNKDKKVFRCKFSGKSYSIGFKMKGKELYHYIDYGVYDDYDYYYIGSRELIYAIPSSDGKMQQIGRGEIRDFAYNNKYYFYIDLKHRLHRQNRKTGKDEIISGIKVSTVDCTKKGLYVQKFDKFYFKSGPEYALPDYAPALYFMNFNGKNVKKISKRTTGHINYEGWW